MDSFGDYFMAALFLSPFIIVGYIFFKAFTSKPDPAHFVLQDMVLRALELKNRHADLQEEIYRFSRSNRQSSISKSVPSKEPRFNHHNCFCCDENLPPSSLVCPLCHSPNYSLKDSIIEKEVDIYRKLTGIRRQ